MIQEQIKKLAATLYGSENLEVRTSLDDFNNPPSAYGRRDPDLMTRFETTKEQLEKLLNLEKETRETL